ncbi:hypothetical protein C7R92_09400 [Brevibacillus porteri]|uniref:Uncharacterized protein n=1 Tax=Brevibacillus porteri TaxID=2126350 RepID=A0ABX5FS75_9BACL|nr:hypothetical protein C7R92_09400 [Brevibacillus porteri]
MTSKQVTSGLEKDMFGCWNQSKKDQTILKEFIPMKQQLTGQETKQSRTIEVGMMLKVTHLIR